MNILKDLVESGPFMPHGHCYFWTTSLIALHAISDALIVLAYYSIPITLIYFVRKRKDLMFHWIFVCFAVFILACGTTHLMEIWNIWHGNYWLSGSIKALTALASLPTAILLVKLVPQALALPGPDALKKVHDELDLRVHERTAELVQTTKALRASEERTRLIIETALDAVITIDSAGLITSWSPQAETAFGWTRSEALGHLLTERIIPERYREAHRRGLQHYLKTGEGPVLNKRIELPALHRDGHEFPVELAITPIRIDGSVAFSAFVRDITERKRAEEELRKSEARFSTVFRSGPVAMSINTLADGRLLDVNEQYCRFFGYSREEIIGRSVLDLNIWANPEERGQMVQRLRQEGAIRSFEVKQRRKSGEVRDVLGSLELIELAGESGPVLISMFIDITASKQAEAKVLAQLERLNLLHQITRAIGERQDLQSILQIVIHNLEDNLPIDFCCVCTYDQPANVLRVVRVGIKSAPTALELAMLEQTTIPIDENGLSHCVQGKLVYEPNISQVEFPFPQRLARGGLRSLVIAPLLVESKVFGVLVAARRQPQSFISGECEFLKQLSEHVALASHQSQLYGALQQAYDDLRQTQQAAMQQERLRALGQMASGIAHDINNAISPVALYTESLLETEPNLSARGRGYLKTIEHAIGDVAQTVARMREFYRQREPQLELATVNLNQLVQQVVDLTHARWSDMPQHRGLVIKMSTDLASDLPPVMGVESEIREALTNLIFNGVDAMPEGGTLTLRTKVVETAPASQGSPSLRHVYVEVADTGVGMDEDTRRRCLEPFFTTKGERGTGLGLAMVYGMVKRHSADIEIESAMGKGTMVRLSFVVPITPLIDIARPARTHAIPSRLRILVVDDDPLLIRTLRDILETDGHEVVTTNGGQAGIDAFHEARKRNEPFAVVITDLGMPYVDGRKVASNVKAASPATPVILLTGWGHRLAAEGDVPSGVDRVLNKPPKLHELRAALAEVTA